MNILAACKKVTLNTVSSPWFHATAVALAGMFINIYSGGWLCGIPYAQFFLLSPAMFFFFVVQVVILCPLVEEYLFRGWLVDRLINWGWPDWAIYLTVTISFAGAHWFGGGVAAVKALLPLSAGLTLLRMNAKDIGPSLVAHAVYNALVLLMAGWAAVHLLL